MEQQDNAFANGSMLQVNVSREVSKERSWGWDSALVERKNEERIVTTASDSEEETFSYLLPRHLHKLEQGRRPSMHARKLSRTP